MHLLLHLVRPRNSARHCAPVPDALDGAQDDAHVRRVALQLVQLRAVEERPAEPRVLGARVQHAPAVRDVPRRRCGARRASCEVRVYVDGAVRAPAARLRAVACAGVVSLRAALVVEHRLGHAAPALLQNEREPPFVPRV